MVQLRHQAGSSVLETFLGGIHHPAQTRRASKDQTNTKSGLAEAPRRACNEADLPKHSGGTHNPLFSQDLISSLLTAICQVIIGDPANDDYDGRINADNREVRLGRCRR